MTGAEVLGWVHQFAGRELFTISGTVVTVMTAFTFLLIVILTFVLSKIIQNGLRRAFRLRGVTDEGTVGVASRLAHYLVIVMGLGIALQTIGINLTALFAAGAFFAVALGFAMQNITENFVSGVILLAERTIKPGDVLEVEGRMVRVSMLGTRSTVVRSLNEEDLIVPNGTLVQSTVKNYTLRDAEYRIRVTVGVAYRSDMKRVREVLTQVAVDAPLRVKNREPVIYLTAFGSSSVDWEVSVWIADPWKEKKHRSDLHEAIWFALKEAGIEIAFPQLDVHLDQPIVHRMEPGSGGV
ncbi:MAG: mechanosensitive ion channel [Gemmatimonadetes bacterium]|nr:mechanosensitive ion channel [Gemmatimonadota bacterium]